MLFRDAAGLKLQRNRVNADEWDASYHVIETDLRERLRSAEFVDMESFLRDAKQHGDDVAYWVSEETLEANRVSTPDLIGSVDGSMTETTFLERNVDADVLLTF